MRNWEKYTFVINWSMCLCSLCHVVQLTKMSIWPRAKFPKRGKWDTSWQCKLYICESDKLWRVEWIVLLKRKIESEGLSLFFFYYFIQCHLVDVKRSPLVEKVGLSPNDFVEYWFSNMHSICSFWKWEHGELLSTPNIILLLY